MAHKKGVGSSRNGRDSDGRRLGCKVFAGQAINAGQIIVRQHGSKFWPGLNVGHGKDDTLFAKIDGKVNFVERGRRQRRFIDVTPVAAAVAEEQAPASN